MAFNIGMQTFTEELSHISQQFPKGQRSSLNGLSCSYKSKTTEISQTAVLKCIYFEGEFLEPHKSDAGISVLSLV